MRVYQPLSADYHVASPSRQSEFETQAELYIRLKKDGFKVRGEITFGRCRFDLVIFKKRKAIAIIETKSHTVGKRNSLDTIQGVKYRQFGVPVIQFYDIDKYDELVIFLNNIDSEFVSEEVLELQQPLRFQRLQTLFGRLKMAAFAAFDANNEVTDPDEKELTSRIEKTLEGFASQIDQIENLQLKDKWQKKNLRSVEKQKIISVVQSQQIKPGECPDSEVLG